MPSYVVTGAARGIGLEFVNQLSADSENNVFAIVRKKATATQLDALARNNIKVLEADVTDAKALKLAAAEVSKVTGNKLDYLINNAGKTNHPGFTLDQFPSPEALENDLLDVFKTNTIGVVHCTNAFLPLLKNGSAKRVISISSGLGDPDATVAAQAVGEPSYSISKAALNMVVAKYAAQYKAEGFTFLSISPGMVKTSMLPSQSGSSSSFLFSLGLIMFELASAGPEAVEELKMLMEGAATFAPHFKGPITPEESVRMQLEVINRWTVEGTGAFVSQFGNKQWL
ncbi:NAD(P)-binding protein [Mycena venus]|uniref:NAD(P)-binding protein n=1 Tax=Mycena venus TaxID=2733690 RepID=A0A8H7CT55_9AGAR|nr:NAD(P)-binding protein [Mycena venus]